jgi:hypothetical protein
LAVPLPFRSLQDSNQEVQVIKPKKKKPALRKSFIFRDVQFFEDPCECGTVLYAFSGGKGKDGPLSKPVMIVGPAGMIRSIKTALRRA